MNYSKSKLNNLFVSDIPIENIFISEFLPDAPGDFVKIYLYGRLQAEHQGVMPEKDMAEELGVTEERIMEAWDYWESWGAIRKKYLDEENKVTFGVEFLNLKEQMFSGGGELDTDPATDMDTEYSSGTSAEHSGESDVVGFGSEGNPDNTDGFMPEFQMESGKAPSNGKSDKSVSSASDSSETDSLEDREIQVLLPQVEELFGRPLSLSEMQKVISWKQDLDLDPEVILYGVKYSIDRGKGNFNYISATLNGWSEQGLSTPSDVEEYISKFDEQFKRYKRIMKALGLYRNPTEEEQRIIESWFTDMGFNMPKILEACAKTAGINSPNIKYVDSVLKNWQDEAVKNNRDVNSKQQITQGMLMEYYAYIKDKAEREAEERKKELYIKVPQVEEMDRQLGLLGVRLGKAIMSKDRNAMDAINKEMERLTEDRAILLAENDFDIDYTNPKYRCKECNDTGIAEMGGLCQVCRAERSKEAEIWLREREEAKG